MAKSTLISENVINALKTRKEELGFTNEVIENMSGVPKSTIAKVFNGTNKSPTMDTLIPIAKVMGVSIDSIIEGHESAEAADGTEITPKAADGTENPVKIISDSPSAGRENGSIPTYLYTDIVKIYEAQLRHRDKWIYFLCAILLLLVGTMVFFLIYDITHPTHGWIEYSAFYQNAMDALKHLFHI